MTPENLNISSVETDSDKWFEKFVNSLEYDKMLLDNDILEDDKKEMYNTMINGNQDQISHMARNASSVHFIYNMIDKYFKELLKTESTPSKMAFEMSDSKVLVWAEIFANDEEMENVLILAEAKINALYSKYGLYISSTIVEDCDGLEVPEHYVSVKIAS